MKITEDHIKSFVSSMPAQIVHKIFYHYDHGSYDLLLQYKRKKETLKNKKNALYHYLQFFILQCAYNPERKKKLSKCVRENSYLKLKNLLKYDQYMEEPLMQILNQKQTPPRFFK